MRDRIFALKLKLQENDYISGFHNQSFTKKLLKVLLLWTSNNNLKKLQSFYSPGFKDKVILTKYITNDLKNGYITENIP